MQNPYSYVCNKVETLSAEAWQAIPAIELVETANGEQPRLKTKVKACWNKDFVCFRFECEDDYIVANFQHRDEPLYLEDVVEVFIDEVGDGRQYQEYEVSPHNVLFDAMVTNDLAGTIIPNEKWNAVGIETTAERIAEKNYVYSIKLSTDNFSIPIQSGSAWSVNFYRIDDDPHGNRHYWAWSPTGKINFHLPAHFGSMIFA
ncbi:hypothetical protein EHS13_22190 [Paenibacillus psychroresistens]|uniref:Carbohydrate-binding domain-containing protein n=1 Tax=Paenibacillus psychroresistens TaxID=1778678 RepID=A0A6B8RM70_9BACL|nr:carbohydrate-binding family 9-like protein [Paenibacillus psychroresistens]QGQ97400.1 hypothetical protein EHS13_22190 [Paenibacillus psychroresistens]